MSVYLLFTCLPLLLVLVLGLLKAVIVIVDRLWWNPLRIQRTMAAQGIRGLPYRFLHGNTREITRMDKEVRSKPIEGLAHDIFPKIQPYDHAWMNQYGRNYLRWHGAEARLVISEPDLAREVLINKEGTFLKPEGNSFNKKLLGSGLPNAQGKNWEKQRKLASHAFHGDSLKAMFPSILDSIKMMLEDWKKKCGDGKEIEVFQEFKLMTSEVISRAAFGSSYVEGTAIFRMLSELATISAKNFHSVRIPGISNIWSSTDEIKGKKLEERIQKAILDIVKKRQTTGVAGDVAEYGDDFLGQLLNAYNDSDDDKKITMDVVIDECKTFYFAGQETVNSSLAWTVFLLAVYPDWQEKARKEVLDVFGDEDPNYNAIPKLKTLTMILNESSRLYTPIIGVTRTVSRESTLGRLILPVGIEIFVASLKLHSDPEIWGDDVRDFNPERFSEGVAKATGFNSAAFLPFSLGSRTCVGMNFAMLELKAALSMILQRYSFSLSPTYVHCPVIRLTTQPLYGIQVIFRAL